MTGAQDPDAVIGFTTEEFESGINLIFYLAMVIIPLNMAGSTYVLYRVLSMTFRNPHRVIPASLRLPFYVVFIDLLCSFTFTAEMVHLYVARRSPDQPYAAILGGCVTFVIVSNFVLVTQAAFFSWNRVVRKKPVDHGPYDVKLIAPAIFVASAVVIVLASIGALGANNYFCWIRKSANGAVLFLVICDLGSMFILWFFYVWIMIEIFKLSRGAFLSTVVSFRPTRSPFKKGQQIHVQPTHEVCYGDSSSASENVTSGGSQMSLMERQIITKICMYMLACFIQYLPGIPYATSFLFPTQPYPLYVLAVISINLGGVVNATALVLNEGLGRKARSSDDDSGTSYFPTSNGELTSSSGVQTYRSDVTAGTASWGRVPSFSGILVTPQSQQLNKASNQVAAMANSGVPRYQFQTQTMYPNPAIAPRSDTSPYVQPPLGAPRYQFQTQTMYPNPAVADASPYVQLPLGAPRYQFQTQTMYPNPAIASRNGPSAYGAVWETTRQGAAPQRKYPPVPPIPGEYFSEVSVKRTDSRRISEQSSNPATMVDVGSSAVSEAYANMARHREQRQRSGSH
ncbi:hypothetical protein BJ742DRAFT_815861 [Cladochytrium replicatum]|nr:hypothetical protein BJ742DRAFT_815861 [Cladochytrium replicatum]